MRIAPVNEKRKRITEQVDEVDRDPAKEEDDPDAPEEFFCSGHSKSLLVKKTMITKGNRFCFKSHFWVEMGGVVGELSNIRNCQYPVSINGQSVSR